MRRQQGFTLLELVVAIVILAGMFAVMYQTLSAAFRADEELTRELVAQESLQRALTFITLDMEQIVARPVRDPLGDYQAAVQSLETGVAVTRLGWANPFDLRHRSQMQRVEYHWQENNLIRRHWDALDSVAGAEPQDDVLLEQVQEFVVRYLHQAADGSWLWSEFWPLAEHQAMAPLLVPLPRSIELVVTFQDGSELQRYFRLVSNPWQP